MNRGPEWKAHVTSRINVNQYHIDHNIPPTEETLFGKYAECYISAFTFSILLFILLFATAFLVSELLHGFKDISAPYVYASSDTIAHETSIVKHAISAYLYQGIQMVLVVTLAFKISTISRSSSNAIALSIGIMFALGQASLDS
ncbi:hypothetical protein A8709_26575 [Paenibacillus pectinilyticus]|uniref:Uncharacterized protein n=1 Tax=Paenibacillus pectinilyticus TaxID=512399 RepID=A0A1C1A1I2_9BACL|nr:hypothetical protein [Paenibacillus pectinilyticus]OCT14383.1 hypothetical protein A8709_26575 [Paenibacillus pectinilyticus]